jgi:hypothetical protein
LARITANVVATAVPTILASRYHRLDLIVGRQFSRVYKSVDLWTPQTAIRRG